jgi:hypothetical protein
LKEAKGVKEGKGVKAVKEKEGFLGQKTPSDAGMLNPESGVARREG